MEWASGEFDAIRPANSEHRGHEVLVRYHSLHEPGRQGLRGGQALAGHDQQFRHLSTDDLGGAEHAIARQQAESGLRHAEDGALGRNGNIAGQCQLAAAAQRPPVHCGDHGQRTLFDGGEGSHGVSLEVAFRLEGIEIAEIRDVAACAESAIAGTREDDDSSGTIRLELRERCAEVGPECGGQRVVLLGTVDRHDGDGTLPGNVQLSDGGLVHGVGNDRSAFRVGNLSNDSSSGATRRGEAIFGQVRAGQPFASLPAHCHTCSLKP